MNGSQIYKCPDCGAYLEYNPQTSRLVCPYCSSSYDPAELAGEPEAPAAKPEAAKAADSQDGFVRSYQCSMCGASIVTEETTAATRCYFCHTPIVLSDRLSEEYHPDGVIPFAMSSEEAKAAFKSFLKKRRFVDHRFFSDGNLENLSGVYYPYWYGTVKGTATFDGEGTKVTTTTTPREKIVRTEYYDVQREGDYTFRHMIRKALQKTERKLSDGIFPFDWSALTEFKTTFLSGFLAEKRDIESSVCAKEMTAEAETAAKNMIRQHKKYDSLTGKTDFSLTDCDMKYILLPVWVLTYRGKDPKDPYIFMMNGQKGTVCGRLPIDKKKLYLSAAIAGAIVAGILCAGGLLLW